MRLIRNCLGVLSLLGLGTIAVPANDAVASSVTLVWTTPGDDSLTGVATAYDMRYSQQPIVSTNFATATPVVSLPTPAPPGSTQSVTVNGLQGATVYYFAIKTVDDRGNWSAISNVVIRVSQTVGVADELHALDFSAAWPNPARTNTRFSFALPTPDMVEVEAFDISGRHVRTLMRGRQSAGRTDLHWDLRDDDGRALEPGIYLVHARLGTTTFNRRVTVLR